MSYRIRPTVILAAACSFLGGCAGGLVVTNTSDHDITFSRRMQGGEVSTTLRPGSSMALPRGSRVNMGDFLVVDR